MRVKKIITKVGSEISERSISDKKMIEALAITIILMSDTGMSLEKALSKLPGDEIRRAVRIEISEERARMAKSVRSKSYKQ